MSSRPLLRPEQVIINGDMTGSITSEPTVIQQMSLISYSVSWAGTSPVGTLSVQVSNDYSLNANGSVKNAGTWATIELELAGSIVTSIPVSGNTGSGNINIAEMAAWAIRLVYTPASGSGSLQGFVTGKVA